ncbi:MAG: hypothetical protein P1S60_07320, partial [Anaerolineae bacterium]|nr:hypothetical protein [Anaerolineae bacterium]
LPITFQLLRCLRQNCPGAALAALPSHLAFPLEMTTPMLTPHRLRNLTLVLSVSLAGYWYPI